MQSIDILMVADSTVNHEVTLRTIRSINATLKIARCSNADQVLRVLRQSSVRGPRLILFDLDAPLMDRLDLLTALKNDPVLRIIPVVILASSSNRVDITRWYAAGANSYIVKPMDMPRFTYMLTQLCDYWFHVVSYPRSVL